MNLLYLHMLFVFGWAVFMVSLAKSVACKENSKILAVLSLIFMLLVLYIGTKLMLAFPQVAKSGLWIHTKLSIDILAMLLNIYLAFIAFKNKTLSNTLSHVIYWTSVIMFAAMYYLTLFRPF
ncbi:hypothetical protein NAMH_0654 [Nautilia profundicola AmH]|uniref:Integral membrane protein n=1 Tax=Nautilia profundicola (strain ATCC BAA-1463 / DSM 18972 / AmH) TaxID=598659 RepID=B9L8V8_NAUPA|nr:hypothetical protein [Nautilia profundicola]ACM92745.1 hypothetical protein NAMH_0654 [Nautilia profundicola AmH]